MDRDNSEEICMAMRPMSSSERDDTDRKLKKKERERERETDRKRMLHAYPKIQMITPSRDKMSDKNEKGNPSKKPNGLHSPIFVQES